MSFKRGRYGIEYNPRPRPDDSSGMGAIVYAIVALAAIAFAVHAVRSHFGKKRDALAPDVVNEPPALVSQEATPVVVTNVPPQTIAPVVSVASHIPPGAPKRPPRVKNLLLRLGEAEKSGNIAMAATTIEQLRSLPGEPVADLDDKLARRLGELNCKWLFELANAQWVSEVQVRIGESATRISSAHGSTLASLVILNGLSDANHIRPGQTLKVMNHPKMSLSIHKRARYADLYLNGKFFNRYDIIEDVACEPSMHEFNGKSLRRLFKELGIAFSRGDTIQLETLMPRGAAILISET